MEKRIGIYKVLDKHNDLLKRMNEDAKFGLKNNVPETDDENNPDDDVDPNTGVAGGFGQDNQQPEMDQNAINPDGENQEDDALDLDALATDDEQMPDNQMGEVPPMEDNVDITTTETPGNEPTDEIDVTQFVEKGTELTAKVDDQVKTMTQQIDNLTQKLSSMDQLINKIQGVEDEIRAMRPPKPIETLKLRSLDSYPYNQGIDDYWKQKEIEVEKLRDFNRVDNQEYVITNDDVNNFSDIEMKDSLNPNVSPDFSPFPTAKTNQKQSSSFNKFREI